LESPVTALPLLPPNVRQINGLQLLRAVAVLLVLWGHAGQTLIEHGVRVKPNLGVFGIDIFFVISGFILSLTVLRSRKLPGRDATLHFLTRRLLRIFPMYWFVAILTLGRRALSGNLRGHGFLPAFLLLPSPTQTATPLFNGYSWTLIFEMFFYYTISLILLRTVSRAVPTLVAVLGCAVVAGAGIGIVHPVLTTICNPILLEFAFGAIVAMSYSHIGRERGLGMVLTGLGILLALVLEAHTSPRIANGLQMILGGEGVFTRVATWGMSAALLVSGLVFWSPALDGRVGKVWVLLGNASYSIYLISELANDYGSRLFTKFGQSNEVWWQYLMQPALMALAAMMGLGLYLWIERPMTKAIAKRTGIARKPMSPQGSSVAKS
jgi:exopolysaccharide production protein ExoZ